MKKNAFMLFAALFLLLTIGACTKSNNKITSTKNQSSSNNSKVSSKPSYHLFYATWKAWGRKAKGCDGWGLCDFKACFSCTVDEAKETSRYVAPGQVNTETNKGNLTINLDPSDSASYQAITTQSPLYVDDDIISDDSNNVVIKAGIYPFNPSIGENGGYVLDVEIQ